MKTSNKLLSGGVIFSIAMLFASLIIVRCNMVVTEQEMRETSGSGTIATRTLTDSITSSIINVEENYQLVLVSDRSDIQVVGDDNIIDLIEIKNEEELNFYIDSDLYDVSPMELRIGISEMGSLTINIEEDASISVDGEIGQDIVLRMRDRASGTMNLNNKFVEIIMEERTDLTLLGSTDFLDLRAEDRASIDADSCSIEVLKVDLEDRVRLSYDYVPQVRGLIRDRSELECQRQWETGNVRVKENAELIISENTSN